MKPPGVVIDKSSKPKEIFFGSPSIVVLPDGTYVASHDFFGPGTTCNTCAVFRSRDRGNTWRKAAVLEGQFWPLLFVCKGNLFIIGTSGRYGALVIRRSEDGGLTWTEPEDENTGLIVPADGKHIYGTAPGALLIHDNRVWKSVVRRPPDERRWGQPLDFFVLSASVDANLLIAGSWQLSTPVHCEPQPPKPWLCDEGNVVPGQDGRLYSILRVDCRPEGGLAGLLTLSPDGKKLSFDPASDFVKFPGGCKKFTVRYDPKSDSYWSLTNYAQDKDRERALTVERQRNTLALTASNNLRDWAVRSIILYHPDVRRVGFQYADWQFDGNDIIAVCRTAFGDAPNCHDANYLTFHRIKDFRNRAMNDKPLNRQVKEQAAQLSAPSNADKPRSSGRWPCNSARCAKQRRLRE